MVFLAFSFVNTLCFSRVGTTGKSFAEIGRATLDASARNATGLDARTLTADMSDEETEEALARAEHRTPKPPALEDCLRSAEFANVAAWMAARRKNNGVVPPLSPYHPKDGSHLLFPTLTAKPFHDCKDDPRNSRLAEAVLMLERLSPLVQREFEARLSALPGTIAGQTCRSRRHWPPDS